MFELTPQHHDELYHYGVPGMRRGVRKARQRTGMPRDSVGVDWRGRPVTPRTHDLYYHPGTGQFVAKRKLTKKQKMLRYGAKAAIGAATGALAYRTMMLNARHSDDDTSELYHYGIKGMKWGRKKSRQRGKKKRKKWRDMSVKQRHDVIQKHVRRAKLGIEIGSALAPIALGAGMYGYARYKGKSLRKSRERVGGKRMMNATEHLKTPFTDVSPKIPKNWKVPNNRKVYNVTTLHSDTHTPELYHYGIKGMKWRLRKKKVRSKERKYADALAGKVKKNSVTSLSNKELRTLTERMRLENDYRRTADNPYKTRARQKGEDMFWKGAGALGGIALGTFGTIAAQNLKSKDHKKRVAAGLKVAKAVTGW